MSRKYVSYNDGLIHPQEAPSCHADDNFLLSFSPTTNANNCSPSPSQPQCPTGSSSAPASS